MDEELMEEELIDKQEDIEWSECECCKIHNNTVLLRTRCCSKVTMVWVSCLTLIAVITLSWIIGLVIMIFYGEGRSGFMHYAWVVYLLSPIILFGIVFLIFMVYGWIKWCYKTGLPTNIEIIDV